MPDTTGSGIAQVSAAGGETTWIRTTLQDVWAVSPVSPDRSELLVSKGVGARPDSVVQLWVQPLPAGAPHPVGNIRAILATWTPDGTHIVYADAGKMGNIMMANGNGSEWQRDSPAFSGLERVILPALRKLVAGRQLLLFSGGAWECSSHLGDAGASFPFSQTRQGPITFGFRAATFLFSHPQL